MPARKQRDKGDGSIYQLHSPDCPKTHTCSCPWRAQIELPTEDGKRRRKRSTHPTRSEALSSLRQMQQQVSAGINLSSSTTTISEWVKWWLSEVAPMSTKPDTVSAYKKVSRNWIEPYIGHHPLLTLTSDDVVSMLNDLAADGRSARSRQYALAVLRMCLDYAERTNRIPRNPAQPRFVRGPKVSGRAHDAMSADQAKQVLDAAHGDRWEALAVLALKLGIRQGELLRLKWSDVDFDDETLTVRDSKSPDSYRTLPLVNGTLEALKLHKSRQKSEQPVSRIDNGGYVFAWEDGRPMAQRTCLKWWHALTESATGTRFRFHSSRHTTATLLLNDGVPVEVVSAILGHAHIGITTSIYAKVLMDLKRNALRKLDGMVL